jgi:hypothetical protein
MKVERQRTLPRLAMEEEVGEMRAQVDDLRPELLVVFNLFYNRRYL